MPLCHRPNTPRTHDRISQCLLWEETVRGVSVSPRQTKIFTIAFLWLSIHQEQDLQLTNQDGHIQVDYDWLRSKIHDGGYITDSFHSFSLFLFLFSFFKVFFWHFPCRRSTTMGVDAWVVTLCSRPDMGYGYYENSIIMRINFLFFYFDKVFTPLCDRLALSSQTSTDSRDGIARP